MSREGIDNFNLPEPRGGINLSEFASFVEKRVALGLEVPAWALKSEAELWGKDLDRLEEKEAAEAYRAHVAELRKLAEKLYVGKEEEMRLP